MPIEKKATKRQANITIQDSSRRRSLSTSAAHKGTTKVSLGAKKKEEKVLQLATARVGINRPIQSRNDESKRAPLRVNPINANPNVDSKKVTKKLSTAAGGINPAPKLTVSRRALVVTGTTSESTVITARPRANSAYILPDLVLGIPQPTKAQQQVTKQLLPVTPAKPVTYIDPDVNVENPQLCSEYIKDIYSYLLQVERKDVYGIGQEFLLSNTAPVRASHRCILVDWLFQVQLRFKLLSETMYLCVDILDRIIQVDPGLPKKKLQLIGVTALLIATKYEEIYPPTVSEMVHITDNTYTMEEILAKEIEIFGKLEYRLNKPYSITFLRRFSTVMATTQNTHNLAKYILELSLLDHRCSALLPSKRAAAALLLSAHMLTPYQAVTSIWNENMAYNTKYRLRDFHQEKLKLKCAAKEGHNSPRATALRKKYRDTILSNSTAISALDRL